MEPLGLIPHSQEPATCPYPESYQSSHVPHPTSSRSIVILYSNIRLGLEVVTLPQVCSPKPPRHLSPIRATCPANFILLYFITRIIIGDEYRILGLKETRLHLTKHFKTGSSKKMDGIWNRYNLKSTTRIYTFGILKCSEKFKVLDLP